MALLCICYKQVSLYPRPGSGEKWGAGEVHLMPGTYCQVILEFFLLRATADLGRIDEESHSCSLDEAKCLKPKRKCVSSLALHS